MLRTIKLLLRSLYRLLDDLEIDDIFEDLFERDYDYTRKKNRKVSRRPETEQQPEIARLLHSRDRTVKRIARRAQEQSEAVASALGQVELLLLRKFSPTELTYQRYEAVSKEVASGVLSNIRILADRLHTLEKLDYGKTKAKIQMLQKKSSSREENAATIERLESREANLLSLSTSVRDLLLENEQAISQLEELCIALSKLRIASGRNAPGIGEALAELDRLVDQVPKYGQTLPLEPLVESTENVESSESKDEQVKPSN